MSFPPMFRIRPFLIIAIASIPISVRRAVQNPPKPSPGRVNRFMYDGTVVDRHARDPTASTPGRDSAEPALFASGRRMATKLDQASLVRMERKRECLKPLTYSVEKQTSVGLMLETGYDIIPVTNNDQVSGCLMPSPAVTPQNCCVRFAVVVAFHDATLAIRPALPLTWAGLPPAGSRQLCLAHLQQSHLLCRMVKADCNQPPPVGRTLADIAASSYRASVDAKDVRHLQHGVKGSTWRRAGADRRPACRPDQLAGEPATVSLIQRGEPPARRYSIQREATAQTAGAGHSRWA
jgi:hypothetical protein